jgi:hypothetical protein
MRAIDDERPSHISESGPTRLRRRLFWQRGLQSVGRRHSRTVVSINMVIAEAVCLANATDQDSIVVLNAPTALTRCRGGRQHWFVIRNGIARRDSAVCRCVETVITVVVEDAVGDCYIRDDDSYAVGTVTVGRGMVDLSNYAAYATPISMPS